MSQDIQTFLSPTCELLGLGEPTHQVPATLWARNELFARLVDAGFRSIALESCHVAGLTVNDWVHGGPGELAEVARQGITHTWGSLPGNLALMAWMREYNQTRAPEDRLSFHGFDGPLENPNAASPRRYLEHARDYLGQPQDIAGLAGDDHRWDRAEAVLDHTQSPGESADAAALRVIAEDLWLDLHRRLPELVEATSLAAWRRARTHLAAGIDLLNYHRKAALPGTVGERVGLLLGLRAMIMTRNLAAVRETEAHRGPTLVFAHNAHLQRNPSTWHLAGFDIRWHGTGAMLTHLLGERYTFLAGSLGRYAPIGLGTPGPGTFEGELQGQVTDWGVLKPVTARRRTDTEAAQGFFPLEQELLDGADGVLHIADGAWGDPA
ncbi:erythromycin esterase-like protein [Crossiella equi]|uniref:Erythromycin esterase-like protein n=1 Tax=Crossiella equi TaxID=130796 RepID=A0ABS5A7I0_9PSEU|nr:erythromycin esterase family protein [Crossiella equi]MBP2471655.1 erythromycin esterase-like protein [Crossiella equi]